MELTEQAARALEAVRRCGSELRFVVDEICHSERYRLSVRYLDGSGDGGSGTDCQAYGVFLLSISALRQGIICLLFPVRKPAYGAWPQLAG